ATVWNAIANGKESSAEIGALESPAAARTLAALAALGKGSQAEKAARALAQMGPVAEPFRRAIGAAEGAAMEAPPAFVIRPFDDAVGAMQALRPKKRVHRGEVDRVGVVAAASFAPLDKEFPDDSAEVVVAPTLYLVTRGQKVPDTLKELVASVSLLP